MNVYDNRFNLMVDQGVKPLIIPFHYKFDLGDKEDKEDKGDDVY
mgnify:CR=1